GPQGPPGTGGTGSGATGPTGATGSFVGATGFNPGSAPGYIPGQVIIYEGSAYVVNVPNPQGTPGSSPDYTLISSAGATGPTGPGGSPTINSALIVQTAHEETTANASISFDTTVNINGTGIAHLPNSTDIIISDPGNYLVMYYIVGSTDPTNSLSMYLQLNGNHVPGSGFFIRGTDTGSVTGQCLIPITVVPSTLQMLTEYATTLNGNGIGLTYPVASISIVKLS
ncbi:hypothetical protein JDS90_30005, partial [Bacillus cereus]|nr:hypothetical protein [Bacillus cereus]